jgi:hypothetical protein
MEKSRLQQATQGCCKNGTNVHSYAGADFTVLLIIFCAKETVVAG